MLKPIPYGISDFGKLVKGNCYYVDKSLFVKDILESSAEVIILPRPRRFGKTLNMTMLRYFLEESQEDRSAWFKDLKIGQEPDYMAQQGKHPVIFLTLKNLKTPTWAGFLKVLKSQIGRLFRDYETWIDFDKLHRSERKYFEKITDEEGEEYDLRESLFALSEYMFKVLGKPPIILIDEYDTPIHAGYLNGFYDEVVDFFQGFLGMALKDNPYLKKAVITGILRVSKESIFSDLNNPAVRTLLDRKYSEYFGLLEHEIGRAHV